MTNGKIFTIHKCDARRLDKIINEPIVDVTITSPPYFDMKDYGYKNQIGFGQSYEKYLDDLGVVFKKVYHNIKKLKLLQENGAVNNELNIQNTELLKKTNIVRYSAGLGTFKDLTQTPSMRKCNSVQAKNIRKKEKTNE